MPGSRGSRSFRPAALLLSGNLRLSKDISDRVEVVDVVVRRNILQKIAEFGDKFCLRDCGVVEFVQEFAERVLMLGDASDGIYQRMQAGISK